MFWEQFWPQLIATLIGLFIGIPVALWISRIQERRTEKERKGKILSALKQELKVVKKDALGYKDDLEKAEGSEYYLSLLRDETWRAFSYGGELEWIKAPDLLNELAEVYFSIKYINFLSEKFFVEIQTWILSEDAVVEELIQKQRDNLVITIDSTVGKIDIILKLI